MPQVFKVNQHPPSKEEEAAERKRLRAKADGIINDPYQPSNRKRTTKVSKRTAGRRTKGSRKRKIIKR